MENEKVSDYSWKVHRSLLRRDLVAGVSRLTFAIIIVLDGLHGVRSAAILVRGRVRCHLPGGACFDEIR